MTKQVNRRSKRSRKPRGPSLMALSRPPQINSNIIVRHKFRFTNTGSTSAIPIYTTELISAMGAMGTTTNSTVTCFFLSARLIKVEAWANTSASNTSAGVLLKWGSNNNYTGTREVSDLTNNPSSPAHIIARPPKDSMPAFWFNAQSSFNIFTIGIAPGGIIDVSLEGVLSDQDLAPLAVAVATAVIGTTYYLALDGPSTNQFVPVGLVSTH